MSGQLFMNCYYFNLNDDIELCSLYAVKKLLQKALNDL